MWNFSGYHEKIAMIDDTGEKLSYRELSVQCQRLTGKIGHRCLVFCLCKNTIGSVIGYAAFLDSRIVPALLSARLKREFLNTLLEIYHPEYLWLPFEMKAEFDGMSEVISIYDYSLLKTGYSSDCPMHEDLALLLTTSGSTGSPKFVRQSYDNIRVNTESIAGYLGLTDTERAVTTLPMNYTYGLSVINTHLFVGATLLLTDKGLMQKEFWDFFKKEEATSFSGVPYIYEMLNKLRFCRMKLPSLRTMTQGGGKINAELHRIFAEYAKENGKSFVVMYGQCEATTVTGYLPPDMAAQKIGSIGIAIPGGKFYLIDDDGNRINEKNAIGELVYEGKNVVFGYAECQNDLLSGDEWGGVLKTGDMARFDEDGYCYILGRKKRFLKLFGNRVSLDEIDSLIKGQFGIEAASTGTDDHMVIFVTDEKFAAPVLRFVADKTGINPIAFKITVIDEIPKNDAGKTLYKDLEKYGEAVI